MSCIREFTDADYPRFTDISNHVYPDTLVSERELRYWDETWDKDRYLRYRVVREDDAGQVIGTGEVHHIPDQFHPDKYSLEIMVEPPARRRGHGGALYDHLLTMLAGRGAIAVRAWAKESETDSHRFLTNRGFREARREWQSRLDVNGFDPAPFAGAAERVANQGIEFTTLAAEQATNDNALADAYELDQIICRDVPDIEPYTEVSFDTFRKNVIDAPYSLPEAFLIAKHDGRFVGLARMFSSEEEPGILYQGLTGVIPEYRGKGIAMALKLATVECARRLGMHEIRTWNDTMNRPMLRINEAMGFQKQPAEIVYLKDLSVSAVEQPTATTVQPTGASRQ
jgi:mycothiol synthase